MLKVGQEVRVELAARDHQLEGIVTEVNAGYFELIWCPAWLDEKHKQVHLVPWSSVGYVTVLTEIG